MKNVKLPDKLSELLGLALDDLEKCERSKKYRVLMHEWHAPHGDQCNVCLAGAVMAKTLQLPDKQHIQNYGAAFDSPFDDDTTRKLRALNCLRCASITAACYNMGIDRPEGIDYQRIITHYGVDAEQFKSDMRQLAKDLEAAGL